MHRWFVVVISHGTALTGCHPPDQAIYDESKNCAGVFDVALRQVRSDQFRKAGLFSDDVDRQAVDSFDGALKFGTNLGLDHKTISQDLEKSKRRAWQTYGSSGDGQSTAKLINAVKD